MAKVGGRIQIVDRDTGEGGGPLALGESPGWLDGCPFPFLARLRYGLYGGVRVRPSFPVTPSLLYPFCLLITRIDIIGNRICRISRITPIGNRIFRAIREIRGKEKGEPFIPDRVIIRVVNCRHYYDGFARVTCGNVACPVSNFTPLTFAFMPQLIAYASSAEQCSFIETGPGSALPTCCGLRDPVFNLPTCACC